MEKTSRRITLVYSGVAAVASFVVQPIPAADELIVVPLHYWFCVRLARARRFSLLKLPWRSVQRIIWYGAAARLVVNFSLGLVPVVGAFSNSITAIALTEFLGRYMDEFMSNPDQPPPEITMDGLKSLFEAVLKKKQAQAPDAGESAPTAPANGVGAEGKG
jgi:uncharacterized protein (DUF697 family)